MNYNSILLIGLLLPIAIYGKDNDTRIKELEESAYLKALEVQQIADQIRKIDNFWDHFKSCYKYQLYSHVQRKLKKTGIDAEVKAEHMDHYITKLDVQEFPIHYKVENRPVLRSFRQSERHEKDIKNVINETEDSMIVSANDLAAALSGIGPFEHELTKELFELNNFDLLKFFFIQSAAEMYLLQHLLARYQKCLQELIAINNELLTLKQKKSYE